MDCPRLPLAVVEAIESQAHQLTDEQREFIRATVAALDSEENHFLYCARLATKLSTICPCHASLVCAAALELNGFYLEVRDALDRLTRFQRGELDLRGFVEWIGATSGQPPDPWREL